jgi:hypothetical protein
MKRKLAATLLVVVALIVATLTAVATTARPALAANGPAWPIDTYGTPRPNDNVILKWDEQLLNAIRRNPRTTGPTVTARAIGVLHTATYDAWAAYDPVADGTRLLGTLRRPDGERTLDNKNTAISYAAYRVLTDLFKDPTSTSLFNKQMADLGYDPTDTSTDPATPQGIGNVAAQAVLEFRRGKVPTDGSARTQFGDGSNQLGDDPKGMPGVPYSDTTGYQPFNTWQMVRDPWRWQPLCVPLVPYGMPCTSPSAVQNPLTPHWENVTPFGPLDPTTHMPTMLQLPGPPKLADGSYDPTDIDTALRDTSSLTDAQKVKAEYWADGPQTELPPGHMATFAQALSRMRNNSLDRDVKLFFALGNALLDASISAWACKYDAKNDFARPITAIRERYKNQQVTSWLGPGNGFGHVLGQNWQPYQALNVVTPPFPEYVSGHSTFSAAGRTILGAFFGTDNFNAKVTIKAGSSKIEPGITPARDVVLSWKTMGAAADEAGWSRRWGGIHFKTGDEHGRGMGKVLAYDVWTKAQTYFDGSATEPT